MLVRHLVPHTPPHIHHLFRWGIQNLWQLYPQRPGTQAHVSPCSTPWSWGRRTPSSSSSPSTCQWRWSSWRFSQPGKPLEAFFCARVFSLLIIPVAQAWADLPKIHLKYCLKFHYPFPKKIASAALILRSYGWIRYNQGKQQGLPSR